MIGMVLKIAAKILTALLYLVTLLSAYGGYIPPRIWVLPSIFMLAFPYLLILSVVTGVVWLLCHSFFPAISAGVVALLCWPVASAAVPVGFSSKPKQPSFSIMTYNVYELIDIQHPDYTGPSRTLGYILSTQPDIVCMQEVSGLPEYDKAKKAQVDSLKEIYPYIIQGKRVGKGLYSPFMLLSKYPAKEVPITWWLFSDCIMYRIELPGMPLYVFNVHLTSYMLSDQERKVVSNIRGLRSAERSLKLDKPIYDKLSTGLRDRQYLAMNIRHVIDSIQGPMVVCGDFNDVPGSYAYRLMRGDDLKDATAKTNFGPLVTYNAHGLLFQIDHILYRGDLTPHSVKTGKVKSSDHYPVEAVFSYHPQR